MSIDSTSSGAQDFDFIIGSWRVQHRRLDERLTGCTAWTEFEGTSVTRKVLGALGNLEDNSLSLPGGTYRAVALRSFDASTGQWSIWWLDGRNPGQLDPPVVGRFSDGVGVFYADDVLNGKPIRVRFTWSRPEPGTPRWEQAFSGDAGVTWETNWTMNFSALDPLATWHRLVESRDPRGLDSLLADDVVFHSPIVHTPKVGKALTTQFLTAAFHVFFSGSFRYVRELRGDRDAMLEFQLELEGITVNGVDLIKWNDEGKIVEFKVMLRPLKAINLIGEKMAAMLSASRT